MDCSPLTHLVDYNETATTTILCANSANIHICNNRNMFESMNTVSTAKLVATIGGQVNFPAGIDTVIWSWRDDNGDLCTHTIKDVHYFPSLPVNILGITAFCMQLKDEVTTGIDIKWKQSRFYWKRGHERWMVHPSSQLPEMPLVFNSHNSKFCAYIKQCKQSTYDTVHFCNSSCYSASDNITSTKDLNYKANKVEVSPFKFGERLF